MASRTGSERSFSVKCDDKGSSIDIQIFEQAGISAENLSLSTWGSSYILANLIHKIKLPCIEPKDCQRGCSILELGAGTGLVGISAAAIWLAHVLLTDLPPILPGLDLNVSMNEALLSRTKSSVSCGTLDWKDPFQIGIASSSRETHAQTVFPENYKADVIFAADTIYSREHPELIVKTLLTWLTPASRSRAILCYPLRVAYLDDVRKFWELMEEAGFECLQEGREEGDEAWNEVANTPYEWCIWAWRGQSHES